jgi:hypothetical protein
MNWKRAPKGDDSDASPVAKVVTLLRRSDHAVSAGVCASGNDSLGVLLSDPSFFGPDAMQTEVNRVRGGRRPTVGRRPLRGLRSIYGTVRVLKATFDSSSTEACMQTTPKPILLGVFEDHFDTAHRYLDTVEQFLTASRQDHRAWLTTAVAGLTRSHRTQVYEAHSVVTSDLFGEFPKLLCYSTFVSIYGLIERDLLVTCRLHFPKSMGRSVLNPGWLLR